MGNVGWKHFLVPLWIEFRPCRSHPQTLAMMVNLAANPDREKTAVWHFLLARTVATAVATDVRCPLALLSYVCQGPAFP